MKTDMPVVDSRLAHWVLGPELIERIETASFDDTGFGFDVFGYRPATGVGALAVFALIYRHWFRVQTHGREHVPQTGAAILAANHSGTLPWDATMIGMDVALHSDPFRIPRAVVDRFAFSLPWVGLMMQRLGQFPGTRRNFSLMLKAGELVLVFPEGAKGTGKPFRDRYRLCRFNVGHVELALEHRVPIVPVAVVGAEEQSPILADWKWMARLLGLPYLPITPTFPWLGPLGLMPLPVRYHICYGEPLAFHERFGPEAARKPDVIRALADEVQASVEAMITKELEQRRGVFR